MGQYEDTDVHDRHDDGEPPYLGPPPDDRQTPSIIRNMRARVTREANLSAKLRRQEMLHDFAIQDQHWFKAHWRPAMAWLYLVICACDFLIFPIGHAALAAKGLIEYATWAPITLQGGGLIHFSFGAVLGVSAWSRGKEKLALLDGVSKED